MRMSGGLDALDGSMEDLMGDRRLVDAIAIGEAEEIEGGAPAMIQSLTEEIVIGTEGEDTRRPAMALLLEGPRIEVAEAGDRLDVPHAGRLVVADQRERTQDPAESDESRGRPRPGDVHVEGRFQLRSGKRRSADATRRARHDDRA